MTTADDAPLKLHFIGPGHTDRFDWVCLEERTKGAMRRSPPSGLLSRIKTSPSFIPGLLLSLIICHCPSDNDGMSRFPSPTHSRALLRHGERPAGCKRAHTTRRYMSLRS